MYGLASIDVLSSGSDPLAPTTRAVSKQEVLSYCKENPAYCMGAKALWSAGIAASVFHGYRRGGVGSAIGWGVLGALFPYITVPIALAQGFGKPKTAKAVGWY